MTEHLALPTVVRVFYERSETVLTYRIVFLLVFRSTTSTIQYGVRSNSKSKSIN